MRSFPGRRQRLGQLACTVLGPVARGARERIAARVEPLEQRQLLAAITIVVTDPRFAPSGGSAAIPNDGIDDAPAIQNAINYVPHAGDVVKQPNGSNYTVQSGDTIGTVYFPTGEFDFVTPPAGGPQGPDLRLKPGVDSTHVRTYQGAPGAILHRPFGPGTFLDHDAPILQGSGSDAHDILISGLTFEGAGIFLEQVGGTWVNNVDVTNCLFRNVNDGDGVSFMLGVTSGATNCDWTGNRFENLNSFCGIFALNVENFSITGNSFENVEVGIQLGGPTGFAVPAGTISNNRMTGITREGVEIIPGETDQATGKEYFYDGLTVKDNVISDFRTVNGDFYDAGCFALEIITNVGTNVVIEGNKLFGKLVAQAPPASQYTLMPVYGIEFSADGVLIKNNLVEGFWIPSAGNAYHDPQSAATATYQGNRFRGEWNPVFPDGIEKRTTATWNVINDNTTHAVEQAVVVDGDLVVANNSMASTDDVISIGGSNSSLSVTVNGSTAPGSPFAITGGIVAYGRDGNDRISVSSSVTLPITLAGGNGNDTLTPGGGPATIYGDADNDTLSVNLSNGGLPPNLNFTGGNGTDAIVLSSSNASQDLDVQPRNIVVNSVSMSYVTVEGVSLSGPAHSLVDLHSLTLSTPLSVAQGQDLTLKVRSLSIAGGVALDLTNNAMIYDYTGASPIATVGNWIASGYAGGAWNGIGISSSTAATTPNRAVGYAEATDLFGTFPATFLGQSVDNTSVLVRYTLGGDATLDQKVDVSDLGKLATNWQQSSRRWSQGDFNYTGAVGATDLGILATNWQQSLGAAAPGATAVTPVPFPSSPLKVESDFEPSVLPS